MDRTKYDYTAARVAHLLLSLAPWCSRRDGASTRCGVPAVAAGPRPGGSRLQEDGDAK